MSFLMGTPKDVMADFTAEATKSMGAGFTCKPIHVNHLSFNIDGKLIPMGTRLRDQVVLGGVIIGLLLEARMAGVNGAKLQFDFSKNPK